MKMKHQKYEAARLLSARWSRALLAAAVLVLATFAAAQTAPAQTPPPDVPYAMRWWNVLTPDEMVASLFGDGATPAQAQAAKKPYAGLDPETKRLVNATAKSIYGAGGHASVGAWWETLGCQPMRVAAGDGNTVDPSSAYCTHYPGSGKARILSAEAKAQVDKVGKALLGRSDLGVYP